MLKINEFLDRTGKTVGAVASITLGVAVISIGAVVIRDHIKSLFRRSRRCKGKIIVCKVDGNTSEHEEEKGNDQELPDKEELKEELEPKQGDSTSKKRNSSKKSTGATKPADESNGDEE